MSRGRVGGWLRWSDSPLAVLSAGRMRSLWVLGETLFLLPALQKWPWVARAVVGVLIICILSIICPNCSCRQLFLVSYSLFVFSCLRKFVQVQALQQRVPGSSLSHLQQQLGGPALPRLNSSVSLAQENGSKFCVPPSHSAYLLKDKISQPWHC